MSNEVQSSSDADTARRIMRRQAALSLRVAAVFVVLLLGIPLLNLEAPRAMATREFGFSLAWLILAVLIYPLTWVLSAYFVKASDRIEAEIARDESQGAGQ